MRQADLALGRASAGLTAPPSGSPLGADGRHYPSAVPVQQDDSAGLRHQEPDRRPLGFITLGFAALSALLALSVFLSPLA